ncbi:hypothetical protein PspLS_05378 [Pyricularia sp. CBS 133598]|nr:hypothetical protein PspLS_05378 [Pyricularia sp. CBS 133598]
MVPRSNMCLRMGKTAQLLYGPLPQMIGRGFAPVRGQAVQASYSPN